MFNDLNIEPNTAPIRGGTDGSQLSFKGLPTLIYLQVAVISMDLLNMHLSM